MSDPRAAFRTIFAKYGIPEKRRDRLFDELMAVLHDAQDAHLQDLVSKSPPAPKSALTIQDCENLFWLAARDIIFFATYNEDIKDWDNSWHAAVNCNDTFYYACADATSIQPNETSEVRRLVDQFGFAGAVAWCAKKRGEMPLSQMQDEKFKAAMNAIDVAQQKADGYVLAQQTVNGAARFSDGAGCRDE